MGNNNVCLAEIPVNGTHHTTPKSKSKWKREDLRSGSCIQTLVEKENNPDFFAHFQCGQALPQYHNKLAQSRWQEAVNSLNTINDSQQTINSLLDRPEFNELVLLGPPKQFRWICWMNLLTKSQPRIGYEKYLENAPTDISNIINDINRTLVDYALFKHRSCGQDQLKRILCAISNALPSMGYCQGMNFICAVLLIVSGCDEHQVFQAFMQMLINEQHLLCFAFSDDMPLHFFLTNLVHHQIRKKFPKLNLSDISDSFWLSKMILSLFTYIFKMEDCIRCWDYLMVRGMIRGIPELILAYIDATYDQLSKFKEEDFAQNFKNPETTTLQFNVGELIYLAKFNHRLDRSFIAKFAKKMRDKNAPSQLLDLLQYYNNPPLYKKHVSFYINTIFY
ncbi:unnamed protein product (macronuclear) [Paramecium tetraurelia]|uniref:Rab-GAP TBC domain-containing protein n=1 Tax=Paramecium tetraurelia TaxID=5888 RepID=A0C5Q4_PARTE|nr:uncharacterized protein GSPATT00035250001 [Paramecium tetraurelia]CAK66121.1 unnamed protein product [Paramecium tetraurelia]|eukprot:XP_001433518.1 hypothetical protein (macronuclear) [Paramecium tetraurelia strain d4-2]